ncbi:MAG: MFS transporter [Spirochaetes bacterium]|nr:MFS transporter [Spirochaetota bacterium]
MTTAPDWKRTFWAILVAEFLALAGFNTSIPIVPFYLEDDLGVTDPVALKLWVGLCQAVVSVTLMVFAPIWGRLADTRGKRLMLVRSTFGGAVVLAVMGIVTRPWQLFALRGFQGVLTGTVAAATVLVASIAPREKAGWALGLLQTGVFAGQSVGPAIGGVLSDLFGHRVNFAVSAVLLVAAGIIVLRFIPRDRPVAPPMGAFWRQVLPDFTPLAANRELTTVLIVSGVVQAATSVVGPILPLFVQSMTPAAAGVASTTGLILGITSVAAAVAAAGVGRIGWRIGTERTLHLCLWGAALLVVPQAFSRTPVQLLVYRTAGALFLGGTMPAMNALIALRTDRDHHGSVFGLSSSFNSAGWALGPMIGVSIAVGAGYPPVFLVTAGGLALTAVAAQVLIRRRAEVLGPRAPAPPNREGGG